MDGASSDACQVIDFFARGADSAHLVNDPFLLHAAQELHPLKRQDLGINPLPKYWKRVQLQSSNDSPGGPSFPARPS